MHYDWTIQASAAKTGRIYYLVGVQVRNMKMVFNISTLGVGSGNEH